jgi:hypothetical protein
MGHDIKVMLKWYALDLHIHYIMTVWTNMIELWETGLIKKNLCCELDTTLCDKVCQWFVTGPWFSWGTTISSTNETDRRNIIEILLKVALNTITLKNLLCWHCSCHLNIHHFTIFSQQILSFRWQTNEEDHIFIYLSKLYTSRTDKIYRGLSCLFVQHILFGQSK